MVDALMAPEAARSGAAGMRGRILIVDDTQFMRTLIKTVLMDTGHTVVGEAGTGREAVSMFRLFRPDVVIMDITMPDQDGLAAMEEILATNRNAQIIICSALQFRRTATEALARGARDFINKPFRPEEVLRAVDNALLRVRRAQFGQALNGNDYWVPRP